LSALDTLDESIGQILRAIEDSESEFDEIILINNAGSLGHVGSCIDSPSLHELSKNIDLNITSSLWMSVRFARFAKEKDFRVVLVNISSLVAVEPFPTLGIYSAGKAARDAYHVAMAKENAGGCIKCLNYAPGPLETDMSNEIRAAPGLDGKLRPNYERKLIDPQESARVLVQLLRENEFENGAHIDYYDVVPHP
jgi:sepiapterin reductase